MMERDGPCSSGRCIEQIRQFYIRPKINEATALGAAFMAGLYIGEFNSLKSISKRWKIDKTFNPNINKSSRIKLLKGWKQAIKRTLI